MTDITTKDHIKVVLVGLINTERPKKERNKRPHEFYFRTQFLMYLRAGLLIELDTNCDYPFM